MEWGTGRYEEEDDGRENSEGYFEDVVIISAELSGILFALEF